MFATFLVCCVDFVSEVQKSEASPKEQPVPAPDEDMLRCHIFEFKASGESKELLASLSLFTIIYPQKLGFPRFFW